MDFHDLASLFGHLRNARPSGLVRLGEVCVKENLITQTVVKALLNYQSRQAGPARLGNLMVRLGLLNEKTLVRLLAKQAGIPSLSLEGVTLPKEACRVLPKSIRTTLDVLPLGNLKGTIVVATSNPLDWEQALKLAQCLGGPVTMVYADKLEIRKALASLPDKAEPASHAWRAFA